MLAGAIHVGRSNPWNGKHDTLERVAEPGVPHGARKKAVHELGF